MSELEKSERRVYVLPSDLVERIRKFQNEIGLSSEVEAVRRLLDTALLSRDNVRSIMDRCIERLSIEKDNILIRRDILSMHPLVKNIYLDDEELTFALRNGDRGRIAQNFETFIEEGYTGSEDRWERYPKPLRKGAAERDFGRSRPSEMDEDIPF